jgi:hypothetical protein
MPPASSILLPLIEDLAVVVLDLTFTFQALYAVRLAFRLLGFGINRKGYNTCKWRLQV